MSSSEEDYGRTERPLPKPSHSAHSHGKNKYSETCGRASETSGTCNRYLDTGDGRISFQEGPSSASRYNEGGNKSYSHSCDGNRYSAPDSRSSSPRYNDQTNSRFSEATETVIRYPGESRGEPCRSSRYADSSGNTYLESSSKVGSYAEGRLPGTEGDIYPNESGGKYTTDRYHGSSSSPERNVEKYGKNEHFIHGEKSELAPERNGRCTVGTPGRHDRNADRSNDKYYSERMSDRTERSHERSEKHADRIPEKYISNGDRYVIHNAQESGSTRGSDRYGASERNFDRYSEDYYQSTDRISSNDQLVESSDGYKSSDRTDGYRPDRFLCSTNVGDLQRFDGYCTLPSHSDKYSRKSAAERFENSRYLPPPAPAPSERYHPPERYIPPPAPSNDRFGQSLRERFLETPSKDRYQDRYIPTPAPERFLPTTYERFQSSTVNPGDPYMRRDLGYHHHYRLPHPNYHVHQQSYYHSQYQRTLPHRSLGSYHHQSVLPSPSRSQLRCCPSPNHYVQPDEITSGSSNSSHSSNVLTANITGSTMPVLAASLTNGQSLKSFSASVNVNIVTAQGTNPSSRDRDRDYLPPCPSPILLNSRGRPTSGNVSRMSSSHAESVGPNVGRHVSTPTPPPSLPRCSSLSSCELNGETTVCKIDHSHHHQYTPARRSCSGTMEPSTSLTVCCSSSRRTNSSALNLNNTVSANQSSTSAMGHTNGSFTENMPKVPSFGTLSSSTVLENGRQGVAVSCVISNSTHSTVWRTCNAQNIPALQSSSDSSRNSAQTPGTDSTTISAQSSLSSSSNHSTNYCSSQPTSQVFDGRRNSASSHVSSPAKGDQPRCHLLKMEQSSSRESDIRQSQSRTDSRPRSLYAQAKKYMKQETISFFGVNENIEATQQEKWIERRKRLALRKYGSLKDDIPLPRSYRDSYTHYNSQARDGYGSRPDILPDERDEIDADAEWLNNGLLYKKPSVFQMTFRGIAYLVTTLTRHRPRTPQRSRQWSRSYAPADVPMVPQNQRQQSLPANEVFFDGPRAAREEPATSQAQDEIDSRAGGDFGSAPGQPITVHPMREAQIPQRSSGHRGQSWQRGRDSPGNAGPEVGSSRIDSNFLGRAFDNSNRRQYGMGILGRLFGRKMKKSVTNQIRVKEQLDDLDDYRPYFTYWVTTVQLIILFISLFTYGFGPAGIDINRRSGLVLDTSLSLQQVDYLEPANFWLGPRASDLIHLGAKYSPCMRRDARIIKEMEKWREKERNTACCIRNDDSGCVQASQADCSKIISTWKKWSPISRGPGGRISGSVCGLDPKFCEAPASVAPHEWPDDITKWPICRKPQRYRQKDRSGKIATAEHMACEVIGHPCCIGIHGTCSITTKEYCDFVKGHFHEEASLCSQVSCLDDVCGMIPFYVPDQPDQFYRLWTSLFLHAGIVHMAVTLLIQLSLMRDLEKLTGPLRIGIIYIGSGVAGNLASAIFVPYRAEVGPAGSQFGLLACLVVEVLNVWPMLQRPENALIKLLGIVLVLFVFGLLPWIDNYAHFFGFVFGFLLSYAFLPFVSFGPYDRTKKVTLIWVCLFSAGIVFAALVVLFYIVPVYECQICNYFNCVPLTRDFCAEQNINFIKNPNTGDI